MNRKHIIIGSLVSVALIALIVYAATWQATLNLDWQGEANRDVNATAQLYAGGIPIGDEIAMDDFIIQWTQYEETLDDNQETPDAIVFRWDYEPEGADLDKRWLYNGNEINPIAGVSVSVNTSGTTLTVFYVDDDD